MASPVPALSLMEDSLAAQVKHNNQLPKNHFHKDWQRRVKTWVCPKLQYEFVKLTTYHQFDQPGKKKSRRVARSRKALATGAAPLERLRPAVRCPTQRYNIRVRSRLRPFHNQRQAYFPQPVVDSRLAS